MKICFIGSGGVGHIRPTLGLVKALVDAGHQVDFWVECIFGNSQAKSLEQAGANYFDIPDQFAIPDLIRCIFILRRYIGLWAGLKTLASLQKDPILTLSKIKAMDTKLYSEF
jgi:UDP-N-acetylglucosamine:LPS N-acetylglucosamine transferase